MLKFGTVFMLAFVTTILSAQTVSTTNRSWQYLTGGRLAAPDSIWDEPSYFPVIDQLLPLGFAFTAFNKPMDSLWLDQGGVLSLDEEVWMGLWEDLCDKGFGKRKGVSPIRIVNSGGKGNAKLEIEWRNFGFFGDYDKNAACTDSGNLRMTISEKSQTVELWFGPSKITNAAVNFPNGVVIFLDRLDSQMNATGIDLKGNPLNPTVVPVNETTHSKLDSWPPNGTVYTFSFPSSQVYQPELEKQIYYSFGTIHFVNDNLPFTITDIQGKIVLKDVSKSKYFLPEMSSGIYVITYELNGISKSIKFKLE